MAQNMVDLGTPSEMAVKIRKCVCHYPWLLFNSDRPGLVYTTFTSMNQKMKQLDTLLKKNPNAQSDENFLSNELKKVLYMTPQQLQSLQQFAWRPQKNSHELQWQMCTRELLRLNRDLNMAHLNNGHYWAIPSPTGPNGQNFAMGTDAGNASLVALLGQLQSVWGTEGVNGVEGAEGAKIVKTRRLACHDL